MARSRYKNAGRGAGQYNNYGSFGGYTGSGSGNYGSFGSYTGGSGSSGNFGSFGSGTGGFGSYGAGAGNYGSFGSYSAGSGNIGGFSAQMGPGGTGGPRRKKKRSPLLPILLSAAAVILLAVVIVLAVSLLHGGSRADASAPQTQTQAAEDPAITPAESSSTPDPAAAAAAATPTEVPTPTPVPDPYDSDLYWYYAQLTDAEKVVYAEFVDAVTLAQDSFTPSEALTVDEVGRVSWAVYGDHPELFWWQQKYTCWYQIDTVSSIDLEYEFTAEELPAAQIAFKAAAEDILSQIRGLQDYEQERIAHDMLCEEITYDYGPNNQTAYGALVDNVCVCNGYARAMQYLMMQVGVPCYYVDGEGYGGDADNKSWGAHAWNIICLQGAFYNLDVTYDDRDDWGDSMTWDADAGWGYDFSDVYCDYENYNLTDDEFGQTHIAEDDLAGLPACTSTACSYASLYGESAGCGMLRQLGLTDWTVVSSLDEYYAAAGSELAGMGAGTYRIDFLVEGGEALQAIIDAHSTGDFWNGIEPYAVFQKASASIWYLETGENESYLGLLVTLE